MQKIKRILSLCMVLLTVIGGKLPAGAENTGTTAEPGTTAEEALPDMGVGEGSLKLDCKSAILMEASTGTILYQQNVAEALPPASVTKIMTLLLVMEAVDAGTVHLEDPVTVSANAASMGGSQVFLKEGEQMPLEEMLKCVVIASANDAAVALAEYLCGSVNAFVEKMNAKARELGMSHTTFENCTGLDDTAERHLTSARDIALMSRALIAHKTILKYSSIWMDTIRDGAFGLTNTNRLVRFYPGCTGLKTGSTSKAGFCVSVTAERDGFSLICVVMGAASRDIRNGIATQLLDWGFANYGIFLADAGEAEPIAVTGGTKPFCSAAYPSFSCVLPKAELKNVRAETELPETLAAPVKNMQKIGTVTYFSDGKRIGSVPVLATEEVGRIGFFETFRRMLAKFLLI